MEPFRITAYPLTPIITDRLMMLDGILLYVAMRKKYGRIHEYTKSGAITSELVDLPLDRRGSRDDWYYAISAAQWDTFYEGRSFWTKRVRKKTAEMIVDFQERRGKVMVESGRYKSYQMPVFYVHARSVSWYGVGDIQQVSSMLSYISHIGKKTSYGWGRVIWQTSLWHSDYSERLEDGTLARPIPTSDDGTLYGIRPPYWLPSNWCLCRMP